MSESHRISSSVALDPTTAQGMEPSDVAMVILNAIECQQEDVIIADYQAHIGILMKTLLPSLFYRLMKRRARKMKQKND